MRKTEQAEQRRVRLARPEPGLFRGFANDFAEAGARAVAEHADILEEGSRSRRRG